MDKVTVHSGERFQLAISAHQKVIGGFMLMADGLAEIRDLQLWKELGAENFTHYLTEVASVSRGHAFKCLKVRDKIKALTAGDDDSSLTVRLESWGDLGISKLDAITSMDDELLRELFSGGSIEIADGASFDISDLTDMKRSEVERVVKEAIQKEKSKRQQAEEKYNKVKAEKADTDKKLESVESRIEHAQELELRYGPVAETLENKKKLLQAASDALDEFRRCFMQSNVYPDDAPSLLERVVQLRAGLDSAAEEMVRQVGIEVFE